MLLEVLIGVGIFLRSDCGGKGRCGKCLVKLLGTSDPDMLPPEDKERQMLRDINQNSGYRLACQLRISGNLTIEIPEISLLNPEVGQKGPILLPEPITASVSFRSTHPYFGLAIDLGTTTIAVYLCDLNRGKVIATTSVGNPQAIFGDDVMSRISAVKRNPGLLKRLQQLAIKAIEWSIIALCQSEKLDPGKITCCTVVGNSTMIHLFVGESPLTIGTFPYTPLFVEDRTFKAENIGFNFNPDAEIYTLPLISGFLGSDIIAAALSTELHKKEDGTMLVDVGTNGEVMLVNKKGLWATSCATGPAFEGATIQHGMRAVSGAIDGIEIDQKSGEIICSIIQKEHVPIKKPSGICGTGVISAVAEFYRAGLVTKDGRFIKRPDSPHIHSDENGQLECVLVPSEKTQAQRAITLTQKDIRAIQLAKGALMAGMELLCEKAGISCPDKLLVAGAFGTYINKKDAQTIRLFPRIAEDNVNVIGNAAGAGAILSLFDPTLRTIAREMAQNTQVLDLATLPEFQEKFMKSLSLSL